MLRNHSKFLVALALALPELAFGQAVRDPIIGGEEVRENHQHNDWIVGGSLVTASDPVLKSTVALYDGQSLCTGSLIDQDIVVTAAHCISDPNSMQVLFTRNIEQDGTAANVTGAVVHPGYNANTEGTANHDDIAIIRFDGGLPAGYAPAKVLPQTTALKNGESVLLAGFGITNAATQAGAGVLRKVSVNIKDAAFSQTEATVDQTKGKGACHGDSGGPAFVQLNGQIYLWGVTSRGYPDNAPDDCMHFGVYTEIDAHLDFINGAISTLRQSTQLGSADDQQDPLASLGYDGE